MTQNTTYRISYEPDFPDWQTGEVTGEKPWLVRITGPYPHTQVYWVDMCLRAFATPEEAQHYIDELSAPLKRWQTDVNHLLDDD